MLNSRLDNEIIFHIFEEVHIKKLCANCPNNTVAGSTPISQSNMAGELEDLPAELDHRLFTTLLKASTRFLSLMSIISYWLREVLEEDEEWTKGWEVAVVAWEWPLPTIVGFSCITCIGVALAVPTPLSTWFWSCYVLWEGFGSFEAPNELFDS